MKQTFFFYVYTPTPLKENKIYSAKFERKTQFQTGELCCVITAIKNIKKKKGRKTLKYIFLKLSFRGEAGEFLRHFKLFSSFDFLQMSLYTRPIAFYYIF